MINRPHLSTKFILFAPFLYSWLGTVHSQFTEISRAGTSIPANVTVEHCAEWQEPSARMDFAVALSPRYETSTEFELPISSDKLFLMARGMASGGVTVRQDGEGDVARVEIVAQYMRFEDLQRVQACAINRGKGNNGVGIFGPQASDPRGHDVSFAVHLHLPVSTKGSVLNVKNFETDMPLFAHHVDDLEDGVHFDSISLKTAHMPIHANSIHARTLYTQTANAPITGTYNVISSLVLSTFNAEIDITANLYNNKNNRKATALTLRTQNGSIRGRLNLTSDKASGSTFAVGAYTQRAEIDLMFLSAPIASALSLNALSSSGSAKVKLHETYQGKFSVRTSSGQPSLVYNKQATDSRGRKRTVGVRQRGTLIEGSAMWSRDGWRLGSANLASSSGSVTLTL